MADHRGPIVGRLDDSEAATSAAALVLAGQGEIKEWQEGLYRTFHEYPELGHQELRTAAAAADALREAGYEVMRSRDDRGRRVMRNGEGPTVLMRADMDALPMREKTGLPYASTDHQTDRAGKTVSASRTPADTTCTCHA